jgi:hypothetical protein
LKIDILAQFFNIQWKVVFILQNFRVENIDLWIVLFEFWSGIRSSFKRPYIERRKKFSVNANIVVKLCVHGVLHHLCLQMIHLILEELDKQEA